MKRRLTAVLTIAAVCSAMAASAAEKGADRVSSPLDFKMKSLKGKDIDLSKYKGKVVLIVNTASQCGLTPQYEGLEALHEKYAGQGLAILGFPANEFGQQEPGTDDEIAEFCKDNYGVKFDMFSKVVVKGEGQCSLYKFLTSKDTDPHFAGDITWNFEKFLLDRDGKIVARFAPKIEPESEEVVGKIEQELKKKPGK